MINSLFDNDKSADKNLCSPKEKERREDDERYNKEYCFKTIKNEEYLWDMRHWLKPKAQYTLPEVIDQLDRWLNAGDNWIHNCGHAVHCMERLVNRYNVKRSEIAKVILENNKITFADKIGECLKEKIYD